MPNSNNRRFLVVGHVEGADPIWTVEYHTDPDAAVQRALRAIWIKQHEDEPDTEYDPDQMGLVFAVECEGPTRVWSDTEQWYTQGLSV